MAPAQIALPTPHSSTPSKSVTSTVQRIDKVDDAPIQTVDALIRHRARTYPHATIVAYPSSGVEFVDYSMQQLDVFAYRTARHYQTFIPTRTSSDIKPTTVAILGPSNFEYAITMLALTKLGHTVLFLSTRISQLAIESLIETTGATYLLADARFLQTAADVQANMPSVYVEEIARASVFDFPIEVHADTRLDYQLDHNVEANNNIYIIHSSGTLTSFTAGNTFTNLNRLNWTPQAYLPASEELYCELRYSHGYESVYHATFVPQPWYLQLLSRNLLRKVHSHLQRGPAAHTTVLDINSTETSV